MDIEEMDGEPLEQSGEQPEGAWVGIDASTIAPLEWAFADYLQSVLKSPKAADIFSTLQIAWMFHAETGLASQVADTHLAIERDLDYLRSQGVEIRACDADCPEPGFD